MHGLREILPGLHLNSYSNHIPLGSIVLFRVPCKITSVRCFVILKSFKIHNQNQIKKLATTKHRKLKSLSYKNFGWLIQENMKLPFSNCHTLIRAHGSFIKGLIRRSVPFLGHFSVRLSDAALPIF